MMKGGFEYHRTHRKQEEQSETACNIPNEFV